MKNDRQKLEKIRIELMNSEESSYERLKKENVLSKLITATYDETGRLWKQHIIPLYEHNVDFLKKVLEDLGYSPTYEEGYNDFFKTTCCIVNM